VSEICERCLVAGSNRLHHGLFAQRNQGNTSAGLQPGNHLSIVLHTKLVRPGALVRGYRGGHESSLLCIKHMHFALFECMVPAMQRQSHRRHTTKP